VPLNKKKNLYKPLKFSQCLFDFVLLFLFFLTQVFFPWVLLPGDFSLNTPEIDSYFYCRYRRKRDKLVEPAGSAVIPTMWGPFTANCYRSLLDGIEHITMVKVSNACAYVGPLFVATGANSVDSWTEYFK